jgi:hypothetical protein
MHQDRQDLRADRQHLGANGQGFGGGHQQRMGHRR